MTSMFVPEIGTEIRVSKPWTFDLYHESRNSNLWGLTKGHTKGCNNYNVACSLRQRNENEVDTTSLTFPVGTCLTIKRIYVRVGAKDFSSITMSITSSPDARLVPKGKKSTTFWVKLTDFNTLNADIVKDTTMVKGAVDTCGVGYSVSDFKKKCRGSRYGSPVWAIGTIDGKPFDGPLNIHYEPEQDPSIWGGTSPKEISYLTISSAGADDRMYFRCTGFDMAKECQKGLPAVKLVGISDSEQTNHFGKAVDIVPVSFDLSFYKIQKP